MNYYEILQISPEASDEVVKAAYKALVKKYHPDNGIADGTEKLQLINEAYQILLNPQSRKAYDESLRKSQSEAKPDAASSHTGEDVWSGRNQEEKEYPEDVARNQAEPEPKSKFGSAMRSIFRGISQELQRNQQIVENAYYEGLNMCDYELVRAYEKNYGLKRQGYAKALEERKFLTRDSGGRLVPTEKFKFYWR